jgi:hypothetical protein
MNLERWDVLESQIVEILLREQASISQAIGAVARDSPLDKGNDLLLASISVCANFNDNFSIVDDTPKISLEEKYEAIAGLSVDVTALRGQGQTCADLVEHWVVTSDNIFSDGNDSKK